MKGNKLEKAIEREKSIPPEFYVKLPDKGTWISYWYQIYEVLKTNPKTVLEIGPGSKIVTNYLRGIGIKVLTVDINENLDPDIICSVTELSSCIRRKVDTVLCAEVLEHIPFEYFEKSIKEIWNVTRQNAIISLPEGVATLRINLRPPMMREFNIALSIPHMYEILNVPIWKDHYWEIGRGGYSLKKVSSILSKYFMIKNTYRVPENPYHRFFILKKK